VPLSFALKALHIYSVMLQTLCILAPSAHLQVFNESDVPLSFALKALPSTELEEEVAAARLEEVRAAPKLMPNAKCLVMVRLEK